MATQLNEWLTIDKTSGTGNAEITLTASSSQELNDRVTSLRINGKGIVSLLNVRQLAFVPTFSISPNPIHFTSDGSEIEVTITGNTPWELIADDWVTISDNYGTPYDGPLTKTIKISADINTGEYRQGVLTVKSKSSDTVYTSVAITQNAFNVEDYVQMVYETQSDNETLYLFLNNSKDGYLTKYIEGSGSNIIWRKSDNVKTIIIDGVVYDVANSPYLTPLRDGFIMPNKGEHYVYVKFTDNRISQSGQSRTRPAFYENKSLKRITIPSHYTVQDNDYHYGLFLNCTNLEYVDLNGVNCYVSNNHESSAPFYGCNIKTILNYGAGGGIRERLCEDMDRLETFTTYNNELPTSIGFNAFSNCTKLSNDFILKYIHKKTGTDIGAGAFKNCSLINGVDGTIDFSGWNNIYGSAFEGCHLIKEVYVNGEGVTEQTRFGQAYVENSAFYGIGEIIHLVDGVPCGLINTTFKKAIFHKKHNNDYWLSYLRQYETDNYPQLEEIVFLSQEREDLSNSGPLFEYLPNIKKLVFNSMLPPIVDYDTFQGSPYGGELIYPNGADYSQILSTEPYYLGYYGWNGNTM